MGNNVHEGSNRNTFGVLWNNSVSIMKDLKVMLKYGGCLLEP